MAITDNLITHVYAETGDTAVTDKIQAASFSGTGTPSLTTIGSEDAWNLVGFDQTVAVPNFSYDPSGTTPGNGYSFALRYRINTFGSTGGYNEIAEVGEQRLTKNGSGLRSRFQAQQVVALTGLQTTGTVRTIVQVVRPNRDSSGSDYTEVWVDQASRGNDDPDFIAGPSTNTSNTVSLIQLVAPDTMDWDLLDFAYWERELTDAEAVAVADDIRSQLPTGSDTEVTASVSTVEITAFAANILAGVTVTATAPAIDITTFAASVSVPGTITTEALKNNTGTVLSSQNGIEVNVYSLADGSHVVRKTGLTSSGSGIVSFSDAAISAGTTYRITVTISAADGVARILAA